MNSADLKYIREKKNAPSALLSYMSTRDFLRTRKKCQRSVGAGECFSHFSRKKFLYEEEVSIFFIKCIVNKYRKSRVLVLMT